MAGTRVSGLSLQINCPGDEDFCLTLDCELPDTGVTAIYGPSGSGKSTLLDCIAGLRRPDLGSSIGFREQNWMTGEQFTPPWQRRVGYVFQDARLFPHLSVSRNLEFAAQRAGANTGPKADKVIDWLDLGPLLQRKPETLSAGQKQRVAIGRALLSAPQLLLLDEPLANLDSKASRQCLSYLQRLGQELDLPMLYVSHDIEEVSQLADYIALVDGGRLLDQGSLLSMSSRLDTRLSHEEQAAAILTGSIAGHDNEFQLTEITVEGQSLYVNHLEQDTGALRRIRIPARDVSICRQRPQDSSILNILPVSVSEIEQCGDARILLRLQLGSQHLLARITRKSATALELRLGDQLFAQIKSTALLTEANDLP